MGALLDLDLNLDAGLDFALLVSVLGANGEQLALGPGATAVLSVKLSALDATSLFQVTTTPGSYGGLALGVAPPAPTGANAANLAELELLGAPLTLSTATPSPVVVAVADLAALAAANTTGYTVAECAIVMAGNGAFFQWSPGDPLTPNGSTIVASTGSGPAGNWLLAPTLGITVTAAAAALLAGIARATFDLVVTWASGSTLKFIGGAVFVTQAEEP